MVSISVVLGVTFRKKHETSLVNTLLHHGGQFAPGDLGELLIGLHVHVSL